MQHHNENLDMDRVRELRAEAVDPADDRDVAPRVAPADPEEWLEHFIEQDDLGGPASLALVLNHLSKAWVRRTDPNVALFHYADYRADLPAELLRLANALDIPLHGLAGRGARVPRRRSSACVSAPSTSSRRPSWASGGTPPRSCGPGRAAKGPAGSRDATRPATRNGCRSLVPPDLAAWAHEGRIASGVDPDI